jgi:threonine dehydrogenase-like Zn-dependent dehydrogenase
LYEPGKEAAIETAGTAPTLRQAMRAVEIRGLVVLVGMPEEDEALPAVVNIIGREYDVRSALRYASCQVAVRRHFA